jgi:hypothetical protein
MTKDEAIQSFQVLGELRNSGKLPPDQQKVVDDACKGIIYVANHLVPDAVDLGSVALRADGRVEGFDGGRAPMTTTTTKKLAQYDLEPKAGVQVVAMPPGSTILAALVIGYRPLLRVLAGPGEATEERQIELYKTGGEVRDPHDVRYLGTILEGVPWHAAFDVFERVRTDPRWRPADPVLEVKRREREALRAALPELPKPPKVEKHTLWRNGGGPFVFVDARGSDGTYVAFSDGGEEWTIDMLTDPRWRFYGPGPDPERDLTQGAGDS